MSNQHLRVALEELQLELLLVPKTKPELQIKRDELAKSISNALADESLDGFKLSLKDVVAQEIESFEVDHPKISALLERTRDMLSSVGI